LKIKTFPSGPRPARIMIVGEAPGEEEEKQQRPFVGRSGVELTDMLHEAGIVRTECFLTNVCKYRPPGNKIELFFEDKGLSKPNELIREGIVELEAEIKEVKPNVIIALGNTPLWALQNLPKCGGITKWRGSELPLSERLATRDTPVGHSCVVIPTYHPAAILRQWSWRQIAVHDLRARVKKYTDNPRITPPRYSFTIRPTYAQVICFLEALLKRLDSSSSEVLIADDIETKQGHISCIGLAVSRLEAICIPLMCKGNPEGYWDAEEETAILWLLHKCLTHPRARVVGQNFLYDAQYKAKHLAFVPRVRDDTMLMQHVAFPSLPKGLDFLSSMYCSFHRYWKDEGKELNPKWTEDGGWIYNCTDAVATFEIAEELEKVLKGFNLWEQYRFQMELWHHTLPMMLRGIDVNLKYRNELALQLFEAMAEREQWREKVLGHPLNPRSPLQMKALFYSDLGLPVQWSKHKNAEGKHTPTLDDKALHTLVKKEPLITELVRNILEERSLGVFNSTFVQAKLGPDNKLRSYFNPAGAETFRFSSSKDAFGSGCNFENVPKGSEDAIDPAELVQYNLPNVRRMFIPPPGHSIGEIDLAGADAQVVAWEAGDEKLKAAFRAGLKIHVVNSKDLHGPLAGPDGKREPYYTRTKSGVHAFNYGARPGTVAKTLNLPVWEAEKFQRRWFEIHPEIKEWHRKVDSQLQATRSVTNKFGFRRIYFDRIEEILPEALAWVPQSTVAIIVNRAFINCAPSITGFQHSNIPLSTLQRHTHLRARLFSLGFRIVNQVHDSLVFIYPSVREIEALSILRELIHIIVPYDDPLVIPWGLKTSTVSWGDVEDRKWPEVEKKEISLIG
jgi:uracil-DNA glycosylase family 4